jgi:hypothetical protein
VALWVGSWQNAANSKSAAAVEQNLQQKSPCFGGMALARSECESVTGKQLVTTPSFAKKDISETFSNGCKSDPPFAGRKVCHYGDFNGSRKIALVGNSHAAVWQPVLDEIGKDNGWRIDTYLVGYCYTIERPIEFEIEPRETNSNGCESWNKWAIDSIKDGGYDLVIMSNLSNRQIRGVPDDEKDSVAREEYRKVITQFTNQGEDVLALRDVPYPKYNVPNCVEEKDNLGECSAEASKIVETDPLFTAAKTARNEHVATFDTNKYICYLDKCYTVIGGVIVYIDNSGHLTKTFVKSLKHDLMKVIKNLLTN